MLVGSNVGQMFLLNRAETVIGRSKRANIQLAEDGVSRAHARVVIEGDQAFIEDMSSRNGTFLGTERLTERRELNDGDKISLAGKAVLRFGFGDRLDESFQQQMYQSALRDGLTMAFNKRYFAERLESEYHFASRHRQPLSLLLMDLDNFKQINDEHGHVAGDHVLQTFAAAIMKTLRNEDVFARYGGEEFAVISRAIPQEHAMIVAERLRARTEGLEIEFGGARIPLTVSIGVASLPESGATDPTALIAAADRALYAAKTSGRNAAQLFSPEQFDEDTR